VGLIVQLTPEAGRAEIETRVRVDEYSFVRAIAEMNDGRLFMAVRYVKASGGCSAPAAGDAQAALARLGQMRLQAEPAAAAGAPQAVQLQINHPNHSGMAMDQATRQFTPAQFVRQIDVTLAGRPVLSAQVDFSLSENPHLRFFVQPGRGGELLARAADTEGRQFSASTPLAAAAL
jgi:sulfur-oxidizing protein SoxY